MSCTIDQRSIPFGLSPSSAGSGSLGFYSVFSGVITAIEVDEVGGKQSGGTTMVYVHS